MVQEVGRSGRKRLVAFVTPAGADKQAVLECCRQVVVLQRVRMLLGLGGGLRGADSHCQLCLEANNGRRTVRNSE